MKTSNFHLKRESGQPYVCAKAAYQDAEITEMIGALGFDGAWICLEHRRLDPSVVASLIQGCRLGGADAIIRIKPANYSDLLPVLEMGASGIMLPRVKAPEEVKAVTAAMKFYPQGERGFDGIHPDARFGLLSPEEYMVHANRTTFLLVQIEEKDVVPHIETIAALPGVDVLFVGPADLTIALGKRGKLDDPEVAGIIQAVADACRKHGKIAGIPCRADEVAKYQALGYRFFNVISDYRCIAGGFREARATALKQLGLPP